MTRKRKTDDNDTDSSPNLPAGAGFVIAVILSTIIYLLFQQR